jgi:hypothetical protein
MLARRQQAFANMSATATLRLATAWSGAVGAMLLILILVRLFN